ncbi:hypothetical protein B0F90DRAFT_1925030 [Multifurca ochricompacta]|uniref:Uncharacterized protein n=1 Tax=Multifurca ochricompacta TaxID=376703 RepID=A0AAD4M5M5_9AGAM|nr:hypothetical protein B0F90DRAFT_1925030 [Multifurca ochricompacta]
MSKHTLSPSSPPAKHARREHQEPIPSSMDVDQEESSSITSSYRLSSNRLELFMECLLRVKENSPDQEIEKRLASIYGAFKSAYKGFRTDFVSEDVFTENAIRGEHFFNVLRRAVKEGATGDDHQAVVTHNVFWTPRPPINEATKFDTGFQQLEESVVMNSWNAEFVHREPLDGLKRHIQRELRSPGSDQKIYARYCSIVQSSGMGKSRLIDELSREDFLIPINLRPHDSKGLSRLLIYCLSLRNRFYRISPPDSELHQFLAGPQQDTALLAYNRASHFLLALFEVTQDTIVNKLDPRSNNAPDRNYRIRAFRDLMSSGQNLKSVGGDRQSFYNKVVARASSEMRAQPNVGLMRLTNAFKRFRDAVNREGVETRRSPRSTKKSLDIEIYISFDEAHSLTTPFGEHDWRSPFTNCVEHFKCWRAVLCGPFSFHFWEDHPILTATFCGPFQPCQTGGIDNTPTLHLPGFDQLMETQKISKHNTLKDVTSLECISHMGRPFFVQRLALDIGTSQFILPSVTPLNLAEIVHEQITNHMRVCISVGKEFESMRGVASSEPISQRLLLVLSGFSVSQEARGELLVAAWFTWARDQVVKVKAKPSLCPHNGNTNQLFEDAFKGARMHFNHFIKPYEQKVLARKYLIRFMARGAAALGANCQPGFDAVYPFLYGDIHLDVQKLGFIIVQVKNNASISPKKFNGIFRDMDPFESELLDASDKKNGIFQIPIIRLLFSLSSKGDPKVERMKYKSPSDGATSLGNKGQALFTSYDYVCSGVSEDILKPVAGDTSNAWKAMVNMREEWDKFFRSSNEPEILRSSLPGTGANKTHSEFWWK